MKSKLIYLCIPSILGICILGFSIWNLMIPDTLFSEYENRILSQKPQFDIKSYYEGTFSDAYENYLTDQFVGRNAWISIKTMTDVLLGKKEVNGVYLAKNHTFIEKHEKEDIKDETIRKRLNLLKNLQKEYPQLKIMLVPTADNIWSDKLPDHALYFDQAAFLQKVKQAVMKENVIDVMDDLHAHKEEYIYYRTDHHWTTLGAYYGYLGWCNEMNMTPVSDNAEVVSVSFLGTLHSKTNLKTKPDSISAYVTPKEIRVYYDLSEKSFDSLYTEDYLYKKNQYGYFLDDNHAIVKIEVNNPAPEADKRTLFVIKDSYANCFIPYLTNHYNTIYVMDLRYFRGSLFSFMEETDKGEDRMDVLVLYNVIHFLQEFQYYE